MPQQFLSKYIHLKKKNWGGGERKKGKLPTKLQPTFWSQPKISIEI